ncbi:MAG: glycosyltransferase family protein [Planctomycetes bacterium]|nr:glycosyltransferase family protein [Planctomycetota bacterium]
MIVAVLQARATSTRLPGKVLRGILGEPMLQRQLARVRRASCLQGVVVATSDDASDDEVAALAARCGVACHRGALDDVLARCHGAAAQAGAEHVVRLTGDCPLVDPAIVDRVVAAHLESGADYTSNTLRRTFPDGLDVEVVRASVLAEAVAEATLPSEREHVTPFVYHRPERYRLCSVEHREPLGQLRWTVDTAEDLEVVTAVFAHFLPLRPDFAMDDVLQLWRERPGLFAANATVDPTAGWRRSLQRDAAHAPGRPNAEERRD